MKKILAFVCMFCPICLIARKYKDSKFAEIVKTKEESCPFCKAYKEVYGKHIDE